MSGVECLAESGEALLSDAFHPPQVVDRAKAAVGLAGGPHPPGPRGARPPPPPAGLRAPRAQAPPPPPAGGPPPRGGPRRPPPARTGSRPEHLLPVLQRRRQVHAREIRLAVGPAGAGHRARHPAGGPHAVEPGPPDRSGHVDEHAPPASAPAR